MVGRRCIQGSEEERKKRPLGRPRRRWNDDIKLDISYADKCTLLYVI
jgi:hypothetical protein